MISRITELLNFRVGYPRRREEVGGGGVGEGYAFNRLFFLRIWL